MTLALFDTNVLLDVFLERDEHFLGATMLLERVAEGDLIGSATTTSITDIWYLVRRQKDWHTARDSVRRVTVQLNLVEVGRRDIHTALADVDAGVFRDFEDAVQHAAAEAAGADVIVTRNEADFRQGRVEALTPFELLNRL